MQLIADEKERSKALRYIKQKDALHIFTALEIERRRLEKAHGKENFMLAPFDYYFITYQMTQEEIAMHKDYHDTPDPKKIARIPDMHFVTLLPPLEEALSLARQGLIYGCSLFPLTPSQTAITSAGIDKLIELHFGIKKELEDEDAGVVFHQQFWRIANRYDGLPVNAEHNLRYYSIGELQKNRPRYIQRILHPVEADDTAQTKPNPSTSIKAFVENSHARI